MRLCPEVFDLITDYGCKIKFLTIVVEGLFVTSIISEQRSREHQVLSPGNFQFNISISPTREVGIYETT